MDRTLTSWRCRRLEDGRPRCNQAVSMEELTSHKGRHGSGQAFARLQYQHEDTELGKAMWNVVHLHRSPNAGFKGERIKKSCRISIAMFGYQRVTPEKPGWCWKCLERTASLWTAQRKPRCMPVRSCSFTIQSPESAILSFSLVFSPLYWWLYSYFHWLHPRSGPLVLQSRHVILLFDSQMFQMFDPNFQSFPIFNPNKSDFKFWSRLYKSQVYQYTSTYTDTHTYTYTYTYRYTYTYTYTYPYIHTHTQLSLSLTHAHAHTHTYLSIYLTLFLSIDIYIYTYIHAHTYIYICRRCYQYMFINLRFWEMYRNFQLIVVTRSYCMQWRAACRWLSPRIVGASATTPRWSCCRGNPAGKGEINRHV